MFYIFHGDNEFSRTQELKNLRAKMGDAQFADLNTSTLDGRNLTLGELRHNADAIPFLSDKRLVIVNGMLARLDPHRGKKEGDAEEIEEDSNPELGAHIA